MGWKTFVIYTEVKLYIWRFVANILAIKAKVSLQVALTSILNIISRNILFPLPPSSAGRKTLMFHLRLETLPKEHSEVMFFYLQFESAIRIYIL
jgi:hypothetical protein